MEKRAPKSLILTSKWGFERSLFLFLGVLGCLPGIVWYICYEEPRCHEIPFFLNCASVPIVDVEIDGNVYPLAVDLGSKLPLSLDRNTITHLNKKDHGSAEWRDLSGNYYTSNSYVLPKIQMGEIIWEDVTVNEESEEFFCNTTLWDKSDGRERRAIGSLGRPLLLSYKILIDVSNSRFILYHRHSQLSKMGYDIKKMTKVPLEEGRGIIVQVETDMGIQRYALDTGATVNVARASFFSDRKNSLEENGCKAYLSQKCKIADHDFEPTLFYLYDITSELKDFDGCLGMRFLKNHVVSIDYPNRSVYIAD